MEKSKAEEIRECLDELEIVEDIHEHIQHKNDFYDMRITVNARDDGFLGSSTEISYKAPEELMDMFRAFISRRADELKTKLKEF